jgi:hypothetical protein
MKKPGEETYAVAVMKRSRWAMHETRYSWLAAAALGAAALLAACDTASSEPPRDSGGTEGGAGTDAGGDGGRPTLALCGEIEEELSALIAANRACDDDSDCARVDTACTLVEMRDHCSGAFYVNKRIVDGFRALEAELTQCTNAREFPENSNQCVKCSEEPCVPACNDGLCGEPPPEGSCYGDRGRPTLLQCNEIEDELFAMVEAHRACDDDSDCIRVDTECTLIERRDHCSGTFYINRSIDLDGFRALDRKLSQCHYAQEFPDTLDHCGECPEEPCVPACNDGLCGEPPPDDSCYADDQDAG